MNRTRPILLGVAALGLLLTISPIANAQQAAGGGQRRAGGRGLTLATLPVPALDSVVMLTADEKSKIETIQATYKTDAAAATGDRAKMREVGTKANDDIKAALTTDQAAKITEMMPSISMLNQSRAVPVSVLAEVKLTADQWTKIKDAAKVATDKVAAADQADKQTARRTANMDFKTAVDGLLTADQKAIVAKVPAPVAPGAPAAPPATKV